MSKMKNPIFSVIICTFNRSNILKKAVQSLIDQSFESENFEIIVMDDGSKDNTRRVVKNFKIKYKEPSIRIFSNKNIGLAHSRNIGAKKARGIYICYIDDDGVADRNWLKNAWQHIRSVKPTPQGITGPILPYYLVKKPNWFKDLYEEDVKGNVARFLKYGEAFSGPNMILKKEFIKNYGGFEESIDMRGELLLLGEETRFFERIWEKDPQSKMLYYSPKLVVYHLVHPYKMTLPYRLKRLFASGQSYYLRNKNKTPFKKLILTIKVMLYFLVSLSLAPLLFLKYKIFQNWVIECIGPIIFTIGFFTSVSRLNIIMKHRSRL